MLAPTTEKGKGSRMSTHNLLFELSEGSARVCGHVRKLPTAIAAAIIGLCSLTLPASAQDQRIVATEKQVRDALYAQIFIKKAQESPDIAVTAQVLMRSYLSNPGLKYGEWAPVVDSISDIRSKWKNQQVKAREGYEVGMGLLDALATSVKAEAYGLDIGGAIWKTVRTFAQPAERKVFDRHEALVAETQNQELYKVYNRMNLPVAVKELMQNMDRFPELRKAIDAGLAKDLGISSDAPLDALRRASGPADVPVVAKLVASRQSNGSMSINLSELKTELSNVRLDLGQMMAGSVDTQRQIADLQKSLTDYIDDQKKKQAAQDAADRQAQLNQLRLDAARSSVNIISTLVSLGNPKLGNQIGVAGNAAIQIEASFTKYNQAAAALKGVDKLATTLGAVAFTGDVIGAAMQVFSLFGDTGPSPDQVILEQIGQVKQMIHDLRLELDGRLTKIDATLEQILTDIDNRFTRLDYRMDEATRALFDLQASLDRVQRDLFDFLSVGFRRPLVQGIDRSLGYRERTGIDMTYQPEFIDAEALGHVWPIQNCLDELEAGPTRRSVADKDLARELSAYSVEANLDYLADAINQKFGLPRPLPSRVANSRCWAVSASFYRTLFTENPQWANRIAKRRAEEVLQVGRDLQSFANAITVVPGSNGRTANKTLTSALLEHYKGKLTATAMTLADVEKRYMSDHNLKGFDIWAASDQKNAYSPKNLASGKVLQRWDPNTYEPATRDLDVPENLDTVLPAPLKLAEQLGLGTLTFHYWFDWYSWTQQNLPNKHNSAIARIKVIVAFNGKYMCEFYFDEPRFWFDFGDLLRYHVQDWWYGSPNYYVAMPPYVAPLKPSFYRLATLSVDAGAMRDLKTSVEQALISHRVGVYRQIGNELASGSALAAAVNDLRGSKLLLSQVVAVGFSRTLELSDLLRAMLFGSQGIPDADLLRDIFNQAALAATDISVPKVDVSTIGTARIAQVAGVLQETLTKIEAGTFVESSRLVDQEVQAHTMLQVLNVTPTVVDITQSVTLFPGGFVFDRATNHYVQQVTLRNDGRTAIRGPISLVVTNPPTGVSVYLPTGTSDHFAPTNSAYVNFGLGVGNQLAPGASVPALVEFTNPNNVPIAYAPRILAGKGDR